MARLSDWTHKIGVAGLTAVNAFLLENYNTNDARQQYAEWVLEDLRFLWKENEPKVCAHCFAKPLTHNSDLFTGRRENEGSLA